MKVIKSLVILILGLYNTPLNAQIPGVCADAVPFSNKSGNCVWLTNMSSDQVKKHYTELGIKPEKVTPVSDKTADGYRLYYCQPGSKGWQKYWIKITTVNTKNSVEFYEDYNPGLLMVPFQGLKSLVGKFGHTQADFKRVYNKYQHLACRLYRQASDNQGNLKDEMSVLYERYEDSLSMKNQNLASADNQVVIAMEQNSSEFDSWDHWVSYLELLDKCGYVTIIEYSISPNQR
ncbi:MAG TPA: hypothetical protein VK212_07560 [Lentimicrobium sp.]|nr:hypothetical protein [Lentimicrobium sp.]